MPASNSDGRTQGEAQQPETPKANSEEKAEKKEPVATKRNRKKK